MNNFKRLHIVSIVSEFFKMIRRIVFPAILAYFIGNDNQQSFIFQLEYKNLIIMVSLIIAVMYGLYRWFTFTYKISHGEIHIKKGMFIKNEIYISKDKIKNVDITRAIIPRLFGLVQLRLKIEGIEDNDPEIKLIAISKKESIDIQNALSSRLSSFELTEDNSITTNLMSKKDLLLSALTSNGLIPAFTTILIIYYQFNQQLNQKIGVPTIKSLQNSNPLLVCALLGAIIILAWVLSIIRTVIRFGTFELSTDGEKIHIQKGLFEKKETIISVKDIKAIRIEENILRQPFGYACIFLESSSGETDKSVGSIVLHPFIRLENIEKVLKRFSLPYPSIITTHQLPKESKLRYIFRKCLLGFILVTPFIYFMKYSYVLYFPALLLFGIWGFIQYKDASYGFSKRSFLLKQRFINKNTIIFSRNHIETIYFYQSFFQRKKGLESIKIKLLSNLSKKSYKLLDFFKDHELDIHQWYRNK
jgi:putative membrane protein